MSEKQVNFWLRLHQKPSSPQDANEHIGKVVLMFSNLTPVSRQVQVSVQILNLRSSDPTTNTPELEEDCLANLLMGLEGVCVWWLFLTSQSSDVQDVSDNLLADPFLWLVPAQLEAAGCQGCGLKARWGGRQFWALADGQPGTGLVGTGSVLSNALVNGLVFGGDASDGEGPGKNDRVSVWEESFGLTDSAKTLTCSRW